MIDDTAVVLNHHPQEAFEYWPLAENPTGRPKGWRSMAGMRDLRKSGDAKCLLSVRNIDSAIRPDPKQKCKEAIQRGSTHVEKLEEIDCSALFCEITLGNREEKLQA